MDKKLEEKIYQDYLSTGCHIRELAEKYGLSKDIVSRILDRTEEKMVPLNKHIQLRKVPPEVLDMVEKLREQGYNR